MMILAQLGGSGSEAASVPRLPPPPMLAHYFLENPWPIAAGLVIGALIGAFLLNRQGRARQAVRLLALGFGLALGIWILAASITTEREALQARTRELADLTAAAKTAELAPMLTDHVSVSAFAGIPTPQGAKAVLEAVRHALGEQFPIKEHTVGPVQAVVDGPNVARTQVRVWVKIAGDQAMYDVPIGAWFRINWTRSSIQMIHTGEELDGPWRITSITVLQLDGKGANPDPGG